MLTEEDTFSILKGLILEVFVKSTASQLLQQVLMNLGVGCGT